MIDHALNRRQENCRALLALWRQFHNYLTACMKGQNFTAQDEANFLKLKSRIAVLHDSFLESVDKANMATAQAVISVVERSILLRQLAKTNTAEMKKMELEWHEAYLLLNETIGLLQEEIDRIAKVSRLAHNTKRTVDNIVGSIGRIVTNRAFLSAVGAIAVLFVLIALPAMDVYDYDFLLKTPITAKIYRGMRGTIRGMFVKELAFVDWEDFNENPKYRRPIPDGFRAEDIPAVQRPVLENLFLSREYPPEMGLQNLDIRGDVNNIKHKELSRYTRRFGEVTTLVVMLNSTAEAQALEGKYNTWRSSLPAQSAPAQNESFFNIGRMGNVVWFVFSTDEAARSSITAMFGA